VRRNVRRQDLVRIELASPVSARRHPIMSPSYLNPGESLTEAVAGLIMVLSITQARRTHRDGYFKSHALRAGGLLGSSLCAQSRLSLALMKLS